MVTIKPVDEIITIRGRKRKAKLIYVTRKNKKQIKSLFNSWKKLSNEMKNFGTRGVNLHETISESAFSLATGCPRVLKVYGGSKTFDNYNPRTHKRLQIKATSVEKDLTSFSPKSEYDELYWLDFYRNGKLDGSFDIYKIPPKMISKVKVSKKQSLKKQQKQKRRPRFSVRKKLIIPYKIKPIKKYKL